MILVPRHVQTDDEGDEVRTITWLIALTLLVASVSACHPNEGPTPQRRQTAVPGPVNEAGEPVVTFSTNVPDRCSPYTVKVVLRGGQGLHPDQEWPVAKGSWSHDLAYKSGSRIHATLSILGARSNCVLRADEIRVMGCKITDGTEVLFRPLSSSGTQVCDVTLKR